MKNEHGIECPIPLEQWPCKAQWCGIDDVGNVDFYSKKLTLMYDEDGHYYADTTLHLGTTQIAYEGGEKHIWQKPKS